VIGARIHDLLHIKPPAVIVATDHKTGRTDVRCQCGKVKSWYGGRVNVTRR